MSILHIFFYPAHTPSPPVLHTISHPAEDMVAEGWIEDAIHCGCRQAPGAGLQGSVPSRRAAHLLLGQALGHGGEHSLRVLTVHIDEGAQLLIWVVSGLLGH